MKAEKKKKTSRKIKKSTPSKKTKIPTLKVNSVDDLPVVYEFLKWQLQTPNSQDLAHFLSDPTAYLDSHSIKINPKISAKFNAQVKSSLKFLGKPLLSKKDFAKHKTVFGISHHSKSFPFKQIPSQPLRGPKKNPRILVKHPQEKPVLIPQQTYQMAIAPLVDARGSGNFDVVLQVGDSFYNQALAQLTDPPPASGLRGFIFEDAVMFSWFLVHFRVELSFPAIGPITFTSETLDMASLAGPIAAKVFVSSDRKSWSEALNVTSASFFLEGPLRSAEEMTFHLGVGIDKDIPLKNTMGVDLRNQNPVFTPDPTGVAVPSHLNVIITQAIRDYFTRVRPWFPVIAQLPTLGNNIVPDPIDDVVPFGSSAVTIPSGGPEPLVSMQFGNPAQPFRQSILPEGNNVAIGVATHILRFLIERNLPALPIAVSDTTTITETEIHFRDGFIEFILHGVQQTCACFFDLSFTLSQKVAFSQDSDGNVRVALLEEHLLSASDRALFYAAFGFVLGLPGLLVAAIADDVFVEALEEEANRKISEAINQQLDVIPQLYVLPLLPSPMPHFLRLKLEDVRIRPSGVFLSGNAMVTTIDPIVAVLFDGGDGSDPFSGRKRFLEMPFGPGAPTPPGRSFSMSLTRSEPWGLINLQAFFALEIRRPAQFQSATRVRITFINDFTGRRRRFQDRRFRGNNFIRISGIENISINPTRVIFTYV
ncbi:hypothetical protein [Bdellovibrio sp. HCB337]|uniref:hypothetical protein n=1 Tax=Bdellovibrio sp. HCB337 TaxID=3394358 RepID=UPI0039A5E062